ncbi:hypothetical protein [Pseudanabaena sp. Chao 1811]|uniref:hypothetical protein n=1 Tax=Pseudanabaena sp. Chao 1811 TaxID=2963092 RepID=UPI0022F39909|nr:hypothetical protein [Pseudanabaena sp. Chao 1811]
MSWSNSKNFSKKWYRIREYQNGDKEVLEADHQWSIEKGLGDDWDANFNHYFKKNDHWYIQRGIKYKYLFVAPEERVLYGYAIEQLDNETIDVLFTELKPIEEWVLYIEERICDCIMAIDYAEAEVLAHQTKIQSYLNKPDGNYGQDIRKHEEWIMKQTQKIEQLKIEKEDFIRKLFKEEGIEW